jgi:hypothetical protein
MVQQSPGDRNGFRGFSFPTFPPFPTFPLLRQPLRITRRVTGRLGAIWLARGEIVALVRAHDGILSIRNASLELPNALADGRPHLRQPLGAEEEERHYQDEQYLPHPEITHRTPLEKRPGDQIRHEDPDQAQE